MNIDATEIIDKLTIEITRLVKENAILKVQIDMLVREKQTHEQDSPDGAKGNLK